MTVSVKPRRLFQASLTQETQLSFHQNGSQPNPDSNGHIFLISQVGLVCTAQLPRGVGLGVRKASYGNTLR